MQAPPPPVAPQPPAAPAAPAAPMPAAPMPAAPMPAAPMPRDLAFALAATAALAGDLAAAIAMFLSHDCWLRISEVAGLRPRDVVHNRGSADPAGRGVAVYLATTKTGRRQAVLVDSPELAAVALLSFVAYVFITVQITIWRKKFRQGQNYHFSVKCGAS